MDRKTIDRYIEISNEEVKLKTELSLDIYPLAKKIFNFRYPNVIYKTFPELYRGNLYIYKENISIKWEEYHCGEIDYNELEFPTSYLFMGEPDWVECEVNTRKKIDKDNQKKKELKKQEQEKIVKENDEKEFERLKFKLGK